MFFLGLVVACGVEVLVDWNQALSEINVLRDQIRQKGQNYAGLLSRVVVEPMQRGHMGTVERLSTGILDDEDAVYVRITDVEGKQLYDRIDRLYEKAYEKRGHGAFRKHYGYFLDRDMRGMASDPEGFKVRLGNSRYRDLPQIWADSIARISAKFLPPPERKPSSREVVYQDRLRDESHKRDDTITWAVAPLVDASSKRVGAVLVAFDMTRINEAARAKYLKFFGMVIFFVGLILLQNIASRRDKLRLLDIEARHRGTKEALRKALPEGPTQVGALAVQGVLEQARGCVDGMVWDVRAESTHAPKETNGEAGDAGDAAGDEAAQANALTVMIVDPDGDGIDAAAVGLHTLRSFRNQTRSSERLSADVVTVGATIAGIPLARPIAILLLRVHESGDFCAQLSDFAEIYLVDGNGAAQRMKLLPEDGEVPPGIVGPLRSCSGTLPVGSTLIVASAGKGIKAAHVDAELLTRHLSRQFAKNTKNGATGAKDLDALALFLRAKQPALSQNDIAVVAVHRA